MTNDKYLPNCRKIHQIPMFRKLSCLFFFCYLHTIHPKSVSGERINLIEETNSLTVENKKPPTRELIAKVIRLFRNNKSSGENNVTSEMLKAGREKLQ